MFVTLEYLKKHLQIDEDFTDDDDYLMILAETAEDVVGLHIETSLDSLEESNGCLPRGIQHAICLLVGNWYNNREAVADVNQNEVPLAYQYLINTYKNYDINTII